MPTEASSSLRRTPVQRAFPIPPSPHWGARDPRLESTPAVPGALIDGRDRDGLEVLHQLIEADLERSLDVALQAEPPRAQVDGVRNEVQMVAHVERGIRGERRQKVWTRRLELDAPVGHTKERQLLRIADERIDAVPVWIGGRAGEAGERRRGLPRDLGARRPTERETGGTRAQPREQRSPREARHCPGSVGGPGSSGTPVAMPFQNSVMAWPSLFIVSSPSSSAISSRM